MEWRLYTHVGGVERGALHHAVRSLWRQRVALHVVLNHLGVEIGSVGLGTSARVGARACIAGAGAGNSDFSADCLWRDTLQTSARLGQDKVARLLRELERTHTHSHAHKELFPSMSSTHTLPHSPLASNPPPYSSCPSCGSCRSCRLPRRLRLSSLRTALSLIFFLIITLLAIAGFARATLAMLSTDL